MQEQPLYEHVSVEKILRSPCVLVVRKTVMFRNYLKNCNSL